MTFSVPRESLVLAGFDCVQPFTVDDVFAQLISLGVEPGDVVLVHSSFRAVRPIENGPLGLIEALRRAIGDEGTLVMPTMTDGESAFDPASTPASGMGITADTFWRQPGVLRSTHPAGSFAAIGPDAERICAPQPLVPPHGPDSPPGRVHELGGLVLLLGVEHSESTMLHVAENIAGVPYSISHPCVVELQGVAERMMIPETDHCCRGFLKMDAWLDARGLQRRGNVGNAVARLADAEDIVAIALEELAKDPYVFLCEVGSDCEECERARGRA